MTAVSDDSKEQPQQAEEEEEEEQQSACSYLCSSSEEIIKKAADARQSYFRNLPTSYEYRIQQIKQILKFLDDCEDDLTKACQEYYNGSAGSHWTQRFFLCKYECHLAIKQLHEWMKPIKKRQSFPLSLMWTAEVGYHARGLCCIIAPWNYPFSLLIRPLIGAICAGNAVILKPSEITDAVARCIAQRLCQYVDPLMVKVVCGGATETTLLLQQKLDFVLFTGGSNIGRIIMKQCSRTLTPVCLELGGKNPVFMDDACDWKTSLRRVCYGRFDLNAGQVCVAPEYVFLSESKVADAVRLLKEHLQAFYAAPDLQSERGTASYYTIVSDHHFRRLSLMRNQYLDDEALCAKVAVGHRADMRGWCGTPNAETRFLPPMVLSGVDFRADPVMQAEVFGPILALVPMPGASDEWKEDAVALVQSREKPLACYVFSDDARFVSYVNERVSAGTIVANDCVTQMALHDVPFGGVGESGCGRYTGKYTFVTFSHEKPLAVRSHGREFLNKDRYPVAGVDGVAAAKKFRKTVEMFYPSKGGLLQKAIKLSMFVILVAFVAKAYKKYR